MNSAIQAINVLLIEENLADAHKVGDLLAKAAFDWNFNVDHFDCVDQAIDRLDRSDVDAILCGFELLDEQALFALKSARAHAHNLPIVVLCRMRDDSCGISALRAGAQDCLNKDEVESVMLSRSIVYGVERARIPGIAPESAKRGDTEDEVDSWVALCAPAPVARKSLGQRPFKEAAPSLFADLVGRHTKLLEFSLEERVMKTNKGVADELKNLAQQLGSNGAGPRDIIELHATAISAKLKGQPPVKAKAIVVEGRVLLIKLMGDLASYYRKLSWGRRPITSGKLPPGRSRLVRAGTSETVQEKDER